MLLAADQRQNDTYRDARGNGQIDDHGLSPFLIIGLLIIFYKKTVKRS